LANDAMLKALLITKTDRQKLGNFKLGRFIISQAASSIVDQCREHARGDKGGRIAVPRHEL
ncbi:hypothetical protein, partial [Thermoplasma sp.]|uniref:hypothetical protein n=1 Tax=Thermoplasma sp. TaxID=1973142 RepID=UPI002639BCB8